MEYLSRFFFNSNGYTCNFYSFFGLFSVAAVAFTSDFILKCRQQRNPCQSLSDATEHLKILQTRADSHYHSWEEWQRIALAPHFAFQLHSLRFLQRFLVFHDPRRSRLLFMICDFIHTFFIRDSYMRPQCDGQTSRMTEDSQYFSWEEMMSRHSVWHLKTRFYSRPHTMGIRATNLQLSWITCGL